MSSHLLAQSCDPDKQLAYYKEILVDAKASSILVQLDIAGKGKGLVATRNIDEGETVFVERPLVTLQHLDNHGSAVVCQACLRFVGSVEHQIGNKLHCLVEQLRGAQPGSVHGEQSGSDEDDEVDLDGALEAGERLEQIYSHVTPERIGELRFGAVTLPLSDGFQLPQPVPCRRRCGALYCGDACEAEAWKHSHCLLCTGAASPSPVAVPAATPASGPAGNPPVAADPQAEEAAADPSCRQAAGASGATGPQLPAESSGGEGRSKASSAGAEAGFPSSSSAAEAGGSSGECTTGRASAAAGMSSAPAAAEAEEVYGIRVDRRALTAFWDHARETNEIFLLAAQVVAATLLQAARLLAACPQHAAATTSAPDQQHLEEEEAPEAQVASAAGPSQPALSSDACRSALLAAWRPYMYGWKRCWWESVAVPDDVEDEEEFRAQLRSLASDSLELLSAAISDPRVGQDLLQLEVYGSIVGMFELNNMGLVVPSPVEDYFLAVDEMEEGAEKLAVTKVTQPLLDALDADYADPCEATAFLALQSCINHSCDPNCTAGCDTADRTVTVLAQRHIPAGEEITLSYIDVSLPYKERQTELRDYGFVCRCARCVSDAAAARAKRQGGARGGVKVGRRR